MALLCVYSCWLICSSNWQRKREEENWCHGAFEVQTTQRCNRRGGTGVCMCIHIGWWISIWIRYAYGAWLHVVVLLSTTLPAMEMVLFVGPRCCVSYLIFTSNQRFCQSAGTGYVLSATVLYYTCPRITAANEISLHFLFKGSSRWSDRWSITATMIIL